MTTLIALVLLASYVPSPPPPTAPTQPSEAKPQKKCDNHTIEWTGCKEGHTLYYTESAWRRVADVRIRQGLVTREQVRSIKNYTSHTDCSLIGNYAYISLNGRPPEKYLILDCSQPFHAAWHVGEGRVAEVNEDAVRRAGCIWPGGETKGRCPAKVVSLRRR